jgi:hypothetical protein
LLSNVEIEKKQGGKSYNRTLHFIGRSLL